MGWLYSPESRSRRKVGWLYSGLRGLVQVNETVWGRLCRKALHCRTWCKTSSRVTKIHDQSQNIVLKGEKKTEMMKNEVQWSLYFTAFYLKTTLIIRPLDVVLKCHCSKSLILRPPVL